MLRPTAAAPHACCLLVRTTKEKRSNEMPSTPARLPMSARSSSSLPRPAEAAPYLAVALTVVASGHTTVADHRVRRGGVLISEVDALQLVERRGSADGDPKIAVSNAARRVFFRRTAAAGVPYDAFVGDAIIVRSTRTEDLDADTRASIMSRRHWAPSSRRGGCGIQRPTCRR
jgi:hypothetical protein